MLEPSSAGAHGREVVVGAMCRGCNDVSWARRANSQGLVESFQNELASLIKREGVSQPTHTESFHLMKEMGRLVPVVGMRDWGSARGCFIL